MFTKKFALAALIAVLPVAAEAAVHIVTVNATYDSVTALAGQAVKAEFSYDDAATRTGYFDPYNDPNYNQSFYNGTALTTPLKITDSSGVKTIAPADIAVGANNFLTNDNLNISNGLASSQGFYQIYLASNGQDFITNGLPTTIPNISSTFGGYVNTPNGNATVTSISFDAPAAAVPEPASWAMMVAGFGLTGAAVRRRRYAVSFA